MNRLAVTQSMRLRRNVGRCIGAAALFAAPALMVLTVAAPPASAHPALEAKGGPGNGFDPGNGHGNGGKGNGHDPGSGGTPGPTVVNVTTKFFIFQEDISEGSLGGETKQADVTLEPSVPTAAYVVGTFTIGCGTEVGGQVTFGAESFTVPVSTTTPGDLVLANLTLGFSHSLPLCGDDPFGGPFTIFLQYSGGSYFSNGTTYNLQPDTWGPVSVVPEGPNESSSTQQP